MERRDHVLTGAYDRYSLTAVSTFVIKMMIDKWTFL